MRTSRIVYALVALLSLSERAAIAQENDTAEIAAAVTRSLTLLQASGRTWIEKSGCVSCHHQALPAVSFALARARGFPLDEEATRQRIQATLARFARSICSIASRSSSSSRRSRTSRPPRLRVRLPHVERLDRVDRPEPWQATRGGRSPERGEDRRPPG